VTTYLKKSGKVREFQSGEEKIRKMSEETVLGQPHTILSKIGGANFFLLVSLAYYLYPNFSIGGATLG